MKVLVTAASKRRGTRFLAEAIGDQLSSRGVDVDVRHAEDLMDLGGYDAVIVGAALKRGRWRRDARQFVTRHAGQLSDRPVWLFATSRPGKDNPRSSPDVDLGSIVRAIGVHEHRVFDVPSERSLRRLAKRGDAGESNGRVRWSQVSDWALSILDELAIQRTWMSGGTARGGYPVGDLAAGR